MPALRKGNRVAIERNGQTVVGKVAAVYTVAGDRFVDVEDDTTSYGPIHETAVVRVTRGTDSPTKGPLMPSLNYDIRSGPVARIGVMDAASEEEANTFAAEYLGVDVLPMHTDDNDNGEFEVVFDGADL